MPATTTSVPLLFIGLMLAMFMFSLNQTVLATALPTIVGELDGWDLLLWVQTSFMLAATIMMPIYGRLGDQFGHKRIFIIAISVFIAGSAIGLFSQNMATFITARVVQGLGGGGMMILSQAIIGSVIPARQRGKYMGVMGAVFAISSVAGPLIGGWLTDGPGWRWAFTINFPMGAIALLAAVFFLRVPHLRRIDARRVDLPGMALIAVFTSAVIFATSWGGTEYAWTSPIILGLGLVAVITAVVFVFVERKSPAPIIPMWLFSYRNFVLTTLTGITIGVAMFGTLAYIPTYLQMVGGFTPAVAGLLMTPMMGTLLVSSIVVGFVVSATGRYKVYPLVGLTVAAVGLGLLSTLQADSPLWMTLVFLATLGLGIGLTMQLLVLVVQNTFSVEYVGTATASNNFFRQVGGTLGMSVVGSLFTTRLMDNLSSGAETIPDSAADGSQQGLTPELVAGLPGPIHDFVVGAYNDALVPIFLGIAPLPLIGVIIFSFVKEKGLATSIRHRKAGADEEPVAEAVSAALAADEDEDTPADPDANATGPTTAGAVPTADATGADAGGAPAPRES